ncbi:MAG: sensor histidine kinase [Synergistaceae bacterium]
MRKNLLLQLTIAVFLPSLGAFLLAWVGFCQFEKTMDSLASSYVQNLARGAAARLESARWDLKPDGMWQPRQKYRPGGGVEGFIAEDLPIPGTFAVFDEFGLLVYGSPNAPMMSVLSNQLFTYGAPNKIRGADGNYYTIAFYPVLNKNLFVLAAVSSKELLGPMVTLTTFWPFMVGTLGLIGIFAVFIMWQKVIMPLKDLEEEISLLKWGEDIPQKNAPEAVTELQKLRAAIVTLAHSAIDKAVLNRRYVTDIVKVQEEERSRISREIHDGPLQDVTAVIQRLRLLATDLDSPEKMRQRLVEAENAALAGVREMREVCNNLTPPWLDLGLAQALTELSERQNAQLGIKINLNLHEVRELPNDVTMAFFRVAQEAVNNSANHANAKEITISLRDLGNKIVLKIEDDGKGFDVPENITELRVKGHRGLSNMQERMSLVGGKLTVSSSPKGTIIKCEMPLNT